MMSGLREAPPGILSLCVGFHLHINDRNLQTERDVFKDVND